MPVRRRYLAPQVLRDLRRKMLFVSGPRQVGKTTLARSLPGARVGYLNWDVAGDRERILRGELPVARRLIFDELQPGRRAPAQVGPLRAGRPRARRRAPLLPRHG